MPSDKLDLSTPDFVNQNIEKIAALFPNCITETAEGKAIDFDLLKQELNHEVVEGAKERYRLEWPGKKEAIVTANLPTTKTLRPVREDSVNFDTTENIYIEGDNLEVLKILQESYLGEIKMIYIDPPYNTGKDFVYKDNFTQDSTEFKEQTDQIDEYGNRLVANPDSAGRYHSDWLSMMYPRLKLARNLLTDDGVIFMSIDDNEVHNLRKIGDEIFGENNFVATVVWERSFSPVNLKKHFSESHDYIVAISKNLDRLVCNGFSRKDDESDRYKNLDNDPRGPWASSDMTVGPPIPDKIYEIETPGGRKLKPTSGRCWLFTQTKYQEMVADNRIWFGKTGNNTPRVKKFLTEVKDGITPMTVWSYKDVGHSQEAAQKLKELFEGKDFFDYPKSVPLLERILQLYTDKNSIILDFFSGSATTAHAVMQLNSKDGGNRKFIMAQLPEITYEGVTNKYISEDGKEKVKYVIDNETSYPVIKKDSEARKAGYYTIPQIGKERIRRAATKIKEETKADIDYGFKVFKVDSSNMQDVYYKPQDYNQGQLDVFADNIKEERTSEDLLTQILLDWGLPLTLKTETLTIQNKEVFRVDTNYLMACFAKDVDEAFAKEIATHQPLRIVFKDSGFKDDTAKENVKQLLKQLSPNTEMKVI
jgi:adenine-specific DNA-methyltransferase